MKFNRFMLTVRLPEQEEELRELVKDNIVNSAVKFFVTIGFTPIVVKSVKLWRKPKDANKFIIFYPEALVSLNGWSSYSTRYSTIKTKGWMDEVTNLFYAHSETF